jgi:hypothetical protein
LKARDLVLEGGSPQSPIVEVEGEMMSTKLRNAVGRVEKCKWPKLADRQRVNVMILEGSPQEAVKMGRQDEGGMVPSDRRI